MVVEDTGIALTDQREEHDPTKQMEESQENVQEAYRVFQGEGSD